MSGGLEGEALHSSIIHNVAGVTEFARQLVLATTTYNQTTINHKNFMEITWSKNMYFIKFEIIPYKHNHIGGNI